MEWCTVFKFVRSCFPWTEEWIIWVSYSFYSLSSPQTKLKSMKKHRAWTTALTSCELTAIIYNFLGPLQSNRDFRAPLAWAIRWYPGFNHWPLPSSRTRRVKNLMDFFKMRSYLPNVFTVYWKICTLYCTIVYGFYWSGHIYKWVGIKKG